MKADLHTHSTISDGVNEPSENVKIAKKNGLVALGITDHDSVAGIEEALKTAATIGIEIVPGIELSTVHNRQDIHILGYFIDYKNLNFLNKIDELQKVRTIRNEMMIDKLNELGIDITMDEVAAKLKRTEANIGRPHIAEVLLDKGRVKSMEEAFDRYLGKKGTAYVNPVRITPEEGINIIKGAGGVPVLAHPGIYEDDELVIHLIKYGLKGIEVYHPDHNRKDELRYLRLVNTYNLLATGGSDYHGVRGTELFHAAIGSYSAPYEVVKELKNLSRNFFYKT